MAEVEKALRDMQPDGSYLELDYDVKPNLFLPSFPHLERLRRIAVGFRHPGSPFYNRPDVKEKLSKGLDHWLRKDPQTDHIWFMVIGIPRQLTKVLILFDKDLTTEQRAGGIVMLKRGYREMDGAYMYEESPGTGTNLVWVARCQVEAGCLEETYDFAFRAVRAIANEIRIGLGEGIQPDLSFHQHGPMLYIGGYGAAFSGDAAEIAGIVHGTSLAFPPAKIEILSRYMLDSQQWAIRGRCWDFNVLARPLAFPNGLETGELTTGVDSLKVAFPTRAVEAACFAQRLRGEVSPEVGIPAGNRHFWCSDYMAHQRPGYFAGVKMVSTRIVGTETGNGQGIKNYYTADGAMSLMKTGTEYSRLMPLWNWRQVPGITCAQSYEPYKLVTWGRGAEGKTTFVGGVSNRTYGVAAFDFDHDGIRARKAWFFFDNEIVCLGAGINAEDPNPVTTTIEQNWHVGNVSARHADKVVSIGVGPTRNLTGARWLLHGTTGYLFPEKQPIAVQIEKRSGSWQNICNDLSPDLTETGEVFAAWIGHGIKPQEAGYAYVVLPNTTADQLEACSSPQILANSPRQQAVWHHQLQMMAVVFYQPGEITLPDGALLSVDKSCVLLAHSLDNSVEISLADPTQTEARITVTVSRQETKKIQFDLPMEKGFAGQSITQTCSV